MEYLLVVLVFFLLAVIQAWLVARFGMSGFSYHREFSRTEACKDERVEYIEVIRNRSPLFLPLVRVESLCPNSFWLNTREEVEIRG